jgi:hypothetical protein
VAFKRALLDDHDLVDPEMEPRGPVSVAVTPSERAPGLHVSRDRRLPTLVDAVETARPLDPRPR